jgi:hypothetical protein
LAAQILERDVHQSSVHGDSRVVDPGIDPAELAHGCLGDVLHLHRIRHVGNVRDGAPPRTPYGLDCTHHIAVIACGK